MAAAGEDVRRFCIVKRNVGQHLRALSRTRSCFASVPSARPALPPRMPVGCRRSANRTGVPRRALLRPSGSVALARDDIM